MMEGPVGKDNRSEHSRYSAQVPRLIAIEQGKQGFLFRDTDRKIPLHLQKTRDS